MQTKKSEVYKTTQDDLGLQTLRSMSQIENDGSLRLEVIQVLI